MLLDLAAAPISTAEPSVIAGEGIGQMSACHEQDYELAHLTHTSKVLSPLVPDAAEA
jgi:hypothetical protein